MDITEAEIAHRLTNQPPRTPGIHSALDDLTEAAIAYGRALAHILPPGRDKSLAVTHLEDSLARAKKAVALDQGGVDPAAGE
jgi:hypothetical protein